MFSPYIFLHFKKNPKWVDESKCNRYLIEQFQNRYYYIKICSELKSWIYLSKGRLTCHFAFISISVANYISLIRND